MPACCVTLGGPLPALSLLGAGSSSRGVRSRRERAPSPSAAGAWVETPFLRQPPPPPAPRILEVPHAYQCCAFGGGGVCPGFLGAPGQWDGDGVPFEDEEAPKGPLGLLAGLAESHCECRAGGIWGRGHWGLWGLPQPPGGCAPFPGGRSPAAAGRAGAPASPDAQDERTAARPLPRGWKEGWKLSFLLKVSAGQASVWDAGCGLPAGTGAAGPGRFLWEPTPGLGLSQPLFPPPFPRRLPAVAQHLGGGRRQPQTPWAPAPVFHSAFSFLLVLVLLLF